MSPISDNQRKARPSTAAETPSPWHEETAKSPLTCEFHSALLRFLLVAFRRGGGSQQLGSPSLTPSFRFPSRHHSSAQKGFLTGGAKGTPKAPETFFQRFWKEEIVAADKREGNLSILWGVAVFAGGIVFARTIGPDVLVPAL